MKIIFSLFLLAAASEGSDNYKKSSLLRKQERDAVRGARRLRTPEFEKYGTGTCTEPLGCPDGSVAICYLHDGSDPHYHSKCLPTKKLKGAEIGQPFSSDKYLAGCGPCRCLEDALGSTLNIKPPGKSAALIASLVCPTPPPPPSPAQVCLDDTDGDDVPDIYDGFVNPASNCLPSSESCTGTVSDVQNWCKFFAGTADACCTGASADPFYVPCQWAGEATIFRGSCNGDRACSFADTSTSTIVGANSCNGAEACDQIGYDLESNTPSATSVSIGSNSCNEGYACYGVAQDSGETISIGDGSCNKIFACFRTGGEVAKSVSIGDGSCNEQSACGSIGRLYATSVMIGDKSCVGKDACSRIGDLQATSVTILPSTCSASVCGNTNPICGGPATFPASYRFQDLANKVTCADCDCLSYCACPA